MNLLLASMALLQGAVYQGDGGTLIIFVGEFGTLYETHF